MEFYWKHALQDKNENGLLTHVLYTHYSTREYDILKKYLLPNIHHNSDEFLKEFYTHSIKPVI